LSFAVLQTGEGVLHLHRILKARELGEIKEEGVSIIHLDFIIGKAQINTSLRYKLEFNLLSCEGFCDQTLIKEGTDRPVSLISLSLIKELCWNIWIITTYSLSAINA
jgi:hypothetical protein